MNNISRSCLLAEHVTDTHLQPLLDELAGTPKPVDIKALVNKYIDWFINFCISSRQIINDWRLMQEADPEIMQYFTAHSKIQLSAFTKKGF